MDHAYYFSSLYCPNYLYVNLSVIYIKRAVLFKKEQLFLFIFLLLLQKLFDHSLDRQLNVCGLLLLDLM